MGLKINIKPAQILASRGLGKSKEAQRFLAMEVIRLSDPYAPMAEGNLKNNVQIEDDKIIYPGPYAHYHYIGIVMEGRAPKHYTSRKIAHHGSPMRGPKWDKRMMADRRKEIEASLEAFVKKRGK